MLSMGNWEWVSNATGYYYDSQGQPLAVVKGSLDGTLASGIYAPDHASSTLNYKGIKVDGSPQTTGALGVTFKPFHGLRVGADWVFEARNYTDATLSGSVNNLFNYNYITHGLSPLTSDGNWRNAQFVFYSFGRTYSMKLRLNF